MSAPAFLERTQSSSSRCSGPTTRYGLRTSSKSTWARTWRGGGSQWSPAEQRGRVIDAPVPPRETMLHVSAYQARPDVGSVVHTHQLIATSIGAGNVGIKPLYNQALPFAPETPIYPRPDLITTLELGNEVAAALGDCNALLPPQPRRHGGRRVGRSLGEQHGLPRAGRHHAGDCDDRRHADAARARVRGAVSPTTGTAGRRTRTSTSGRSCRA